MFCGKCGKQIPEEALFCPYCGEIQTIKPNNQPTRQIVINIPKSIDHQRIKNMFKKRMLKVVLPVVAVVVAVAIIFSVTSEILSRRATFDIEYSENGIEEFFEVVCKNADAEECYLDEIEYGGIGVDYGSYYVANVIVKPREKVEETVYVSIQQYSDSDEVFSLAISFSNEKTKNEILCRKILVEAIEKSFGGVPKAEEYIDDFKNNVPATTDELNYMHEYYIGNDAGVSFVCKRDWLGNGWVGNVIFYNEKNSRKIQERYS